MRKLASRKKGYTKDSDKLISPEVTVADAKKAFGALGNDVLAETRRIDTGRLGIPVFLSVCGDAARAVMPTRKQMGKGASVAQAEASALMELAERYSFFSFWNTPENFTELTYSEARELYSDKLIPVSELLKAVGEELSEKNAIRVLDLIRWRFCPAVCVESGETVYIPLDFFKKLNEFNGSSAGNCLEESILQGTCELVERHVCAIIDHDQPHLPTIDPTSVTDPILVELLEKFTRNGITVILKDFTLGMPVPTVGAVAYDPASFPEASEIVFTAGTSTSPSKAAIRALTEIAQLAGDFESGSNYEASGLSKFTDLADIAWLEKGTTVSLTSLPDIEDDDILIELRQVATSLAQRQRRLFSVETTQPSLGIPTNYNIVPGFLFRERTPHASLGLFAGRILAEEASTIEAIVGLETLAEIYPQGHFLSFFHGLLALRTEGATTAAYHFERAISQQPDDENKALALFYLAYSLTLDEKWQDAVPLLNEAITRDNQVKEYFNLRGVCAFKAQNYEAAATDFEAALDLDSGSAMDLANLGLCHKFLGRTEAAIHCLNNALRLDPSLDFIHDHLKELIADDNSDT
ncbi:YcaO-like family protein [Desulfovibrio inopinatus]|uniref:YcaO-like family protein n=1 Tax=Desulfovibrio inopinatus TaxID=102109 RepID=UPI00041976CC|nr:YcaO-like family protein [Desulfovibrio inopinatus]